MVTHCYNIESVDKSTGAGMQYYLVNKNWIPMHLVGECGDMHTEQDESSFSSPESQNSP